MLDAYSQLSGKTPRLALLHDEPRNNSELRSPGSKPLKQVGARRQAEAPPAAV